jgi:CheY-like chemotaxis protein
MTREEFITLLRADLMHLDDFNSLRNSPLLHLLCSAAHSPSSVVLQNRLVSSIHQIRYAPSSNAQRFYQILHYRYIEHLSQTEVAFQLGISERQLRREQTNAIELLAEQLWQEIEHIEQTLPEPGLTPALYQAEDQGIVNAEMDWLRQQLPRGSCDIEETLAKILIDATTLAADYHVGISHEYCKEMGTAAAPPVALRQSFLTVLTAIVPKIAHQQIHITAQRHAAEVHIGVDVAELNSAIDNDSVNRIQIAHQILSPFGGSVQLHHMPPLHVSLRVPTVNSVTVLVVDDNPDATGLMHRYAQESRFHIITSNNGLETLRLACEDKVKAILIDIMMPEIDGWDLLAELRHHPETQNIPVAVCSVLPQAELSRVLGARMFIQKPLTQEVFLKSLDLLTSA